MRKVTTEEKERQLRLALTRTRRLRKTRHSKEPQPTKRKVIGSQIVDHFAARIGKGRRGRRKSQVELVVPANFSFIENPDESIAFLNTCVESIHNRARKVVIDHRGCKANDLCAEAVLSALGDEGKRNLRLSFAGYLPKEQNLRSMVLASGLPKVLGVSRDEFKDFHCFPLRHGRLRRERARRSSEREMVATDLTTYVESCYLRYGWALNADALEYLSVIVGEVIGNAEDHSRERDWWAAAYLHDAKSGASADCHLTLFSFGSTIHQSLGLLLPQSFLRRRLAAITAEHSRRGFFLPDRWTEENLWTLYALQEGVSRYNGASKELGSDRGQGTADMIEFFQKLGGNATDGLRPRMCVVSGATQILFDSSYEMRRVPREQGFSRRVLAFNDDNDLLQRPDAKNVRALKHFFPGTMISLRFYVDHGYLTNLHLTGEHSVRPA